MHDQFSAHLELPSYIAFLVGSGYISSVAGPQGTDAVGENVASDGTIGTVAGAALTFDDSPVSDLV